MVALQCEFCGGKLITKAGGICECDSCGMQFDKTWVKEKIQEIKGTVKVEGTVEVQGTVKIDGPIQVEGSVSKENLLERGNLALADCHWKEAEGFFDRVLNLEPHSSQAYLGKYMAWMEAKDFETLKERYANADVDETTHSFLKRAKEFADPAVGAQLKAMEALRQATLPARQTIYSKANNRLYDAVHIVAAKTLDHRLLIDGHYDKVTSEYKASYIFTHTLRPFCDEWYDVDKVFGKWDYASTCPGGQEVVDRVEEGGCLFAVNHSGNVYAVDDDPDWNTKLKSITKKWADVEVILACTKNNSVLAKSWFGSVYYASDREDEQKAQQKVDDWQNIVHIALNEVGAFGLSKEGRVFCVPFSCWDVKDAGDKIAAEIASWTDIRQIIVGERFVAGLTGLGEVKLAGVEGGIYDQYDIVQPVASQWKRVRHLDSANDLSCIFEDGTACNVHDGIIRGDWSAATKIYHDEDRYYGIGEDGSVCVGRKAPLPDGVIKQEEKCRLYSNGKLTGLKTKKKVLDFVGYLTDDKDYRGMVLYEDGTVEVFKDPPIQYPDSKTVGWREFNTSKWKLFKSRATFDQEYQQGLEKKLEAQDSYERYLAETKEQRKQQQEKQRADEYEKACALLDKKQSEIGLMDALSIFEKLKDYRNAVEKITLCQTALAEFREQELLRKKKAQYQKACEAMKHNNIEVLRQAIWSFKNLGNWEDSAECALRCNEKIETLKRWNSLQSQKQNLEKELDELGFFARKRKKEIVEQIQSIETEIDRINKEELT